MARAHSFQNLGQVMLDAQESGNMKLWRTTFQDFCKALDEQERSIIQLAKTNGTSSSSLMVANLQTIDTASGVRSNIKQAGIQSIVSPGGNGNGLQSNATDDSDTYTVEEATPASGETIMPGMAVTVANRRMWAARATDTTYPMCGVALQATGNGNSWLWRTGGTAVCLTLTLSTRGIMYLSTVPGYLTDDPTEATGGARVLFQVAGQWLRPAATTLGTVNNSVVRLSIGGYSI